MNDSSGNAMYVIAGLVVALLGVIFGILRYQHSRKTTRMPNLILSKTPTSVQEASRKRAWARIGPGGFAGTDKAGKSVVIPFSSIAEILSADPIWNSDDSPSAENKFHLQIENSGSLVARNIKFVVQEALPEAHLAIVGGDKPSFEIAEFHPFELVCDEITSLAPGQKHDINISIRLASPKELRALTSTEPILLFHCWIMSDDTPSQNKWLMILVDWDRLPGAPPSNAVPIAKQAPVPSPYQK